MSPHAPRHRSGEPVADDVVLLQQLGYSQELRRRMSGFSNFAVSFSIICILAGGITSMHQSIAAAGGFSIGVGWPVSCLFSYLVAMALAQLASAFPTAGGLYHWAAYLAGRDAGGRPRVWGWATAWFNLLGLLAVLAAIDVAAYDCFVKWVGPELGWDFATQELLLGPGPRLLAVFGITVSQALLNLRGIRVASLLTDFSGYLILAVSTALGLILVLCAPELHPERLIASAQNYSGADGGDVWPVTTSLLWIFALGFIHPAYTMTGFDASAHVAEETVGAARTVPAAIKRAVLYSSLFGWLMLASIVVSIVDLDAAAQQGDRMFPWILRHHVPELPRIALYVGILTAQYLCGLASVTSASRMMYAFARDGGLPGWLRRVDPRSHTPTPAIWATAAACCGFTAIASSGRAYEAMSATAVMFLYISYVLPIVVGWVALRRGSWRQMGPYVIFGRRWGYLVVAPICALFCLLLLVIGCHANPHAQWLVLASFGLVLLGWYGHQRRRFQGPPHSPDPRADRTPLRDPILDLE